MELYERVRALKKFSGSLDALAKAIKISPQQLSAYSNIKSQTNFYPLLPAILDCYPNVSREWLYFGEGEMEKKYNKSNNDNCLNDDISILIKSNKELVETNRKIVDALLKYK